MRSWQGDGFLKKTSELAQGGCVTNRATPFSLMFKFIERLLRGVTRKEIRGQHNFLLK